MCGISGILALRPSVEVPPGALEKMTRAMAHRGPDGEGLWTSADRACGFGHRRLAILDLSPTGHQPMRAKDGRTVITFNGEIYNFKLLRSALEAQGHVFSGSSDTEVLLALYQQRGQAMLAEVQGDFAFAIYDDRKNEIFLARDRAGVKPLYYAVTGDYFIFASEVRAILASGLVEREVDEQALYHYLTYLVSPPGVTMVRGIRKLETGMSLRVSRDGAVSKTRYWDPLPGCCAVPPAALDEELAALFDDSVALRLQSDVPVGLFFSGGVDSTLNAGSFARIAQGAPIEGFTVGMPGTPQDESRHAAAMAHRLGIRQHQISVGPEDIAGRLDDIVMAQDEPLSDPVCLPLYFVSALARKNNVTVLQAGEGADELFCGYSGYMRYLKMHRDYWMPIGRAPRFLPAVAARAVHGFSGGRARFAPAADALRRLGRGDGFFMSSAIGFYETEKPAVLGRDYARAMAGCDSFDVVRPLYQRLSEQAPEASFLQSMTYIELHLRLPELLLMRADKMAMAHGLEVRVPFLDHRLIEFAMRAPDGWKLRRGIPKEPVKNLAARYVPREDIYRPKQGFGAPLRDWYKGALGRRMEEVFTNADYGAARWFDAALLQRRLASGAGSTREAFQLWTVFNFLLWKKLVLDAN